MRSLRPYQVSIYKILGSMSVVAPIRQISAYTNTVIWSADVKGGRATLTRASVLRMKMFMAKYQIPVVIAEYDAKNGIFEEY